jgi:hypothetical protein
LVNGQLLIASMVIQFYPLTGETVVDTIVWLIVQAFKLGWPVPILLIVARNASIGWRWPDTLSRK